MHRLPTEPIETRTSNAANTGALQPPPRVLRVYIAGPYRASNAYLRELNIRTAEMASLAVLREGALPVCPHTQFRFFQDAIPDHVALQAGLAMLQTADAVLLVDGWQNSEGTKAEIAFAKSLGLRIFSREQEALGWIRARQLDGTALHLHMRHVGVCRELARPPIE